MYAITCRGFPLPSISKYTEESRANIVNDLFLDLVLTVQLKG